MFKEILLSVVSLIVYVNCIPNPNIPSPPMPPGMPSPPGMPMNFNEYMSERLTRIARQAPPEDVPSPPSMTRIARQAPPPPPEGAPAPPSLTRVARQTFAQSPEMPKSITQEAFYSTITTINRNKRGTSRGR